MAKHLWKIERIDICKKKYGRKNATHPEALCLITFKDMIDPGYTLDSDLSFWEMEQLLTHFKVKKVRELIGIQFRSDIDPFDALRNFRIKMFRQNYKFPAEEEAILEAIIVALALNQCPDLSVFDRDTTSRALKRAWVRSRHRAGFDPTWLKSFKKKIKQRSAGQVVLKRANKNEFPHPHRHYVNAFLHLVSDKKVQLLTLSPFDSPVIRFHEKA